MALVFPSNPTIGQTYQSGSTATYQWNGSYWTVVQPTSTTVVSATSASFSSTAVSASFSTSASRGISAVSASALSGSVPTYVFAQNSSAQSIPHNAVPTTIVTNWTNLVTQNAGEWNATTGVFTATKAGLYSVSTGVALNLTTATIGNQFNVAIVKNSTDQALAIYLAEDTTSLVRPSGTAQAIVSLAVGDTLTVRVYQFFGSAKVLTNQAAINFLNIQELPVKIQK